jgi:hypothetical protein
MQPSVIEVVHGVIDGIERIDARFQRDPALGGKRHQFGEIVVGANQIAQEVDLLRDDVDRRTLTTPP